jgi:hypothetical protein
VARPRTPPGRSAQPAGPQPPTVWERYKRYFLIWTLLSSTVSVVAAVHQIARWPVWALALLVPCLAAALASTEATTLWRPVLAAILALIIFGVALVIKWEIGRLEDSHTHPAPRHRTHHVAPTLLVRDLAGEAIRLLTDDGTDLWAVAGAATLLRLDGATLLPLGAARHFPGGIEHVVLCDRRLLLTYDDGRLAEIPESGEPPIRRITYGHPVPAGSSTGLMGCAGNTVYVALALEAEVLHFALPSLKRIGRIHGAAQRITALGFSHGTLYVEDSPLAAVITFNHGIASRWKMTSPSPAAMPASTTGVLLIHARSQCIGSVSESHGQEVGLTWSAASPIRALAVTGATGVALDTTGHIYRFNALTGSLNAIPIRIPSAEFASTIALTSTGRTILTMPSADQIASVAPNAWKPLGRPTEPAPPCLDPTE